ncbi:ATPase [Sphingomonas sp. DBB INV C78]|uniref:ATP-binding protein n=1 Tax=Sphingomonas sp. DBB INV C78 TaxID=3349434 RepID=UPI0036D26BCC
MNEMPALSGARADRRRLDELFDRLRDAISGNAIFETMPCQSPSRIDEVVATFALNPAELTLLMIAAAQEMRPDALAGNAATAGLAQSVSDGDIWAALCPQGALRRWHILELEGAGPIGERRLRIDERMLHHMLGVDYLDPRLEGLIDTPPDPPEPSADERSLAADLARLWRLDVVSGWPVLQLGGAGSEGKFAVAALLAEPYGQRLFRIARADIPHAAYERLTLARLCDRELALSNGLLVVTGDSKGDEDERAAAQFVDMLLGPTIVVAADPLPLERRRRLRADMPGGSAEQRRMMWTRALGTTAQMVGEAAIDQIAGQFSLDSAGIRMAADLAQDPARHRPDLPVDRLWDAARAQARQRIDDLAERIDSKVGWDDLVLPPDRLAQLRDIAVHVRRAHQVHESWGWSQRGARGLGVTALFAGPSGTGKTMAAEIIAAELRLDLYRIDLSQVVSKYIGETEKNLRRIFEAAETGGAILLFDEADALFGKRSEVKDSHDRYANVEISYLLQRMEAYRGLAILTTNLKSSLDNAFMRRLRFVVDFPFPDATLRSGIWQRIFPADTPVADLDMARLARLQVAGGAIRTIAINAAFLAAEDGRAVDQQHVLAAARREYAKLEKPITIAEFGGAG